MPIKGSVTIVVLNDYSGAVTAVNAGENDPARTDSAYLRADRDCDVDAAVIDEPAAAEGIEAPPHAGCNGAVHWQVEVRPCRKRDQEYNRN